MIPCTKNLDISSIAVLLNLSDLECAVVSLSTMKVFIMKKNISSKVRKIFTISSMGEHRHHEISLI